jgi:plastocyanin
MRRNVTAIALVLSLTVLTAACGGGGGSGTSQGGESSPTETGTQGSGDEGGTLTIQGDVANDHGSADVAGKSEAEVELDDFYFDPTVIRGQPGQRVKLELKNEGSTEHNFTIDDQNIDQDVEQGEDATVTVTVPSSGVVEFYCEYHRSSGMVGELRAA